MVGISPRDAVSALAGSMGRMRAGDDYDISETSFDMMRLARVGSLMNNAGQGLDYGDTARGIVVGQAFGAAANAAHLATGGATLAIEGAVDAVRSYRATRDDYLRMLEGAGDANAAYLRDHPADFANVPYPGYGAGEITVTMGDGRTRSFTVVSDMSGPRDRETHYGFDGYSGRVYVLDEQGRLTDDLIRSDPRTGEITGGLVREMMDNPDMTVTVTNENGTQTLRAGDARAPLAGYDDVTEVRLGAASEVLGTMVGAMFGAQMSLDRFSVDGEVDYAAYQAYMEENMSIDVDDVMRGMNNNEDATAMMSILNRGQTLAGHVDRVREGYEAQPDLSDPAPVAGGPATARAFTPAG